MPINIIKRPTAREVEVRWLRKYKDWADDDKFYGGASKAEQARRLAALPDDASREDIDNAIGNISWTAVICEVCRRDSVPAISFEASDERDVTVCKACLKSALKRLEG